MVESTTKEVKRTHTNEQMPGHATYYEKDGVRTYGDGENHDHEPPMEFKRVMSLIAMAFRKLQLQDRRRW